jgi:hypothetical protein
MRATKGMFIADISKSHPYLGTLAIILTTKVPSPLVDELLCFFLPGPEK